MTRSASWLKIPVVAEMERTAAVDVAVSLLPYRAGSDRRMMSG